jgi:predicted peptidase
LAARELPLWFFHGGRDTVVPPSSSLEMAVALEAAGHPDVRLTVHEDLGHNVWTRVYESQDLYTWFLKHHRK